MSIRKRQIYLLFLLAIFLLIALLLVVYYNSKTQFLISERGNPITSEVTLQFGGEKYYLKVVNNYDHNDEELIFTDGKDLVQVLENGGEHPQVPDPMYDTFEYNQQNYLLISSATAGGPKSDAGISWRIFRFDSATDKLVRLEFSLPKDGDFTLRSCFLPEYLGNGVIRLWSGRNCSFLTEKKPFDYTIDQLSDF